MFEPPGFFGKNSHIPTTASKQMEIYFSYRSNNPREKKTNSNLVLTRTSRILYNVPHTLVHLNKAFSGLVLFIGKEKIKECKNMNNWSQGYREAKMKNDETMRLDYPHTILVTGSYRLLSKRHGYVLSSNISQQLV